MKNFIREDVTVWTDGIQVDVKRKAGTSLTMFLPFQVRSVELKSANTNSVLSDLNAAAALPAEHAAETGFYRNAAKRFFDVALVLAALPIVVLIVGLCALCLALEGGNPFYTQERLGRNGKRFRILKLRSMVHNADAKLAELLKADPVLRDEWERSQKLKNDPRITRLGAFLRSTSLDELPQLWNVLRGDMSLVGPRPMMPEQLALYGDAGSYFRVRPGITGIWQVSVRNESSFAHRNKIDAVYDRDLSFSLDLQLLFKTVGVVVRGTGY